MILSADAGAERGTMNSVMSWIWMLPSTHATQVRFEQHPCPVDAMDVVRVYEQLSTNTHGGYDSDLAQYASNGQFRTYAVATCAQTLFSLRGEDMTRPIPHEQLPALERALQASIQQLADPSEPQVWERYEIAAQMHQVLEAPALDIAELYLHASWTARDEVVGFHRGLEGPAAVRYLLAQGPEELKRPLSVAQRRTVLYSLARVAHRGGYAEQREDYLRQFEQIAPLTGAERQTVDRFRHISSVTEPYYQDLAIAWLEKGLREADVSEADRIHATYLLADLFRRRGRAGESVALYQEVATHPDAPDLLRGMASSLLEEVGG
jgi:hypothetical protein